MNEEELKKLWKADQTAPTIDFAIFQKSLIAWQNKLRRKAGIDIWVQSIITVLVLVSVYFYPKMIFLGLYTVVLCIWYVRELRRLYKPEISEVNDFAVRHSLNAKIQTMKNYFRRTRVVTYLSVLLVLPAAYYGLNIFDNPSITTSDIIRSLIFTLILCEILIVIVTEIYFAILYTPALNELKKLLRQLDANE